MYPVPQVITLTQAEVESAALEAVLKFHREQQGRAPREATANLLRDMIVIRSTGAFTQTEEALATTKEGRRLIRSARRDQRALTRRDAEARVAKAIGLEVIRSFYDIDVRAGEQVEVYVLQEDLSARIAGQP